MTTAKTILMIIFIITSMTYQYKLNSLNHLHDDAQDCHSFLSSSPLCLLHLSCMILTTIHLHLLHHDHHDHHASITFIMVIMASICICSITIIMVIMISLSLFLCLSISIYFSHVCHDLQMNNEDPVFQPSNSAGHCNVLRSLGRLAMKFKVKKP